jgi:hypothetical protein
VRRPVIGIDQLVVLNGDDRVPVVGGAWWR